MGAEVNSMQIKKTSSLNFVSRGSKRGSRYDGVFEAMSKLKPGQSIVLPKKKGTPVATLQNRLGSAMRRSAPKPPAGHRWATRTTEDGRLAIVLVKRKRK